MAQKCKEARIFGESPLFFKGKQEQSYCLNCSIKDNQLEYPKLKLVGFLPQVNKPIVMPIIFMHNRIIVKHCIEL